MEIVKFNQYTPSESIVLLANKGIKIKELSKSEISKKLNKSIISGLIILGQGKELTSNQITVLTDCLTYEVKTNLIGFSMEEIELAIEMGCKGKLCEITKLTMPVMSQVNILKFISIYKETIRRDAIHKQREEKEKQDKIISDIERLEKIKQFEQSIIIFYSKYPQIDLNYGVRASYYRHLDKKGLIDLTIETKNILMNDAQIIKDKDVTNVEGIKIEYTLVEIAQALALNYTFEIWQFEGFDLTDKL